MRVEISRGIFPHPPSPVQLHAIAALALHGRHRIWLEDESDPQFQVWFAGLDDQHRDEWNLIIAEGYALEAREPAARSIAIETGSEAMWDASPPTLPLAVAFNYLSLPFIALLEDWSSDRGFLLAVATPEQRRFLENMVEKGALVFDNGGGITNMPRRVAAITENPGGNIRLWVMFDGDAMRPLAWSPDATRLQAACDERCVPCRRLSRRSIENYLPPDIVGEWADALGSKRREKIRAARAFNRLAPIQQHHFNMKDGFDQDAKRTDATAGNLYADLDPADRRFLARGFGEDIANLYLTRGIDEAHLRANGSWDEISDLVGELVALVR